MITNFGVLNLCGRAFPCDISGAKNRSRRCKETVLLNLEPTGRLERPAFSLPRKCWWTNFPTVLR